MIRIENQKRPWFVLSIGFLISIITNLPALLKWQQASINDWGYFNALSLFVRSAILNFKTFLMYDPWFRGGFDEFANPENRIFSPMGLLDIAFPPQFANIFSLIIFGTLGFLGCYYLLKHYRISFEVNLIISTLFINAQWFGLHFGEGHITFGAFLVIPWILYCILNIEKRKFMFLFVFLCALFLLNGSFYTFIFSIFLFLCGFLFGLVDYKKIFNVAFFKKNTIFIILLGIAFFALVAVKMIPVLTNESYAQKDNVNIYFTDLIKVFANYLGTPLDVLHNSDGYHEFGCFVGFAAFITFVIYLVIKKRHFEKSSKFLLLIFFFFWIGTNWGGIFNPYTIISKIPLINIAHVQSRYLLLFYLFFLIVLAFALQKLKIKNKKIFYPLVILLILESFFVRMYPLYKMYESAELNKLQPLTTFILTNRTLPMTVRDSGFSYDKPFHYFTNNGTKEAYEPMSVATGINYVESPTYRGEVYFKDESITGKAEYTDVIPGRITFHYKIDDPAKLPAVIEINLNWAHGFKVLSGKDAKTFSSGESGLINVEVKQPEQTIVLQYDPWYLTISVIIFVFGSILWVGLFIFIYKKELKPEILAAKKKLVVNSNKDALK